MENQYVLKYDLECGCVVAVSQPDLPQVIVKWCSTHEAAPDLVEALKNLLALFDDIQGVGRDSNPYSYGELEHLAYPVVSNARAALRKAGTHE